jgi:hyperosmotically inducible protein
MGKVAQWHDDCSMGLERYCSISNPFERKTSMTNVRWSKKSWLGAAATAAAAVLLALSGCAGDSRTASTGQMLDDTAITAKVKTAFVADKEVSAMNISVNTDKGVVQLSGTAGPNEAKRAAELARGVAGVKAVRNDIVVK